MTRRNDTLTIQGKGYLKSPHSPILCNESGSTLRFLIPFASLVDDPVVFSGEGKLVTRPLEPYFEIFKRQGIRYYYGGKLPLMIDGKLKPAQYHLPGDISSQFVTGLMYILPLLKGDSEIILTSVLESKDYVALTIQMLAWFGIKIEKISDEHYLIRGNQKYKPARYRVEGDYSQSAFWIAAGLMGSQLNLRDIFPDTKQGDKRILDIVKAMGGEIQWTDTGLNVKETRTHSTVVDASQCPDLVPIVATMASVSAGETRIINARRARIKESDRLSAICMELKKLGANIVEEPDGLIIKGVERLSGGVVEGWNDHRIVMSLAIASIKCEQPVTIQGCEAVRKSYPHFFEDFKALGGIIYEE